jgi:ATP phosphoribosyltransferase
LVVAIPDEWIDVQTIADLEEIAFEFKDKKKKRLRVGTKYPNLTREFLFSKGVTQFKLVDSLGATETYPFTGSAEIITDITSTGETLRANNLRILKDGEILKSEACMMISKSSFKNKAIQSLVKLFSKN